MATWLSDVRQALQNLGGEAHLSDLYPEVKGIRPNVPSSHEAQVRRTLEIHSSDSEAFDGNDVFYSARVGSGIWGLRAMVVKTPISSEITNAGIEDPPDRKETTTYRILRDTRLARMLKELYQNKCQVCCKTVQLSNGKTYAEAHHIIPLGKPHFGPDSRSNVLVLCPNHHVQFDYGAIELTLSTIHLHPSHEIDAHSIDYHNKNICKNG